MNQLFPLSHLEPRHDNVYVVWVTVSLLWATVDDISRTVIIVYFIP